MDTRHDAQQGVARRAHTAQEKAAAAGRRGKPWPYYGGKARAERPAKPRPQALLPQAQPCPQSLLIESCPQSLLPTWYLTAALTEAEEPLYSHAER